MRYLYLANCWLTAALLVGCTSEQTPTSPGAGSEEKGTTGEQRESGEEGVTAHEVRKQLDEAAEAVQQYSAQETEQILEKAGNNLEEVRQKIGKLRENAGDLQEAAQTEFNKSIEDLESKLNDAEQRLDNLRDTGGEAWTKAQDDLQESLGNLERAYEEAAATFEKTSRPNESETEPSSTSQEGN